MDTDVDIWIRKFNMWIPMFNMWIRGDMWIPMSQHMEDNLGVYS